MGASHLKSTGTEVDDGFVYVPVREDLLDGNQFILSEEGVHDIVLGFLEKNASAAREEFELDVFGPDIYGVYRELFKFIFFFTCDAPANRVLMANERIMWVLHGYLEWWPGSDVVCVLREILVNDESANDLIMESHVHLYCRKLMDHLKRLSGRLIKEQEAARNAGAAEAERTIPSMPSFRGAKDTAMKGSLDSVNSTSPTPMQLNKTRHEPLHLADVVAAVDVGEWYGSRVDWSQASELVLLLLEILECNRRPVERLQRLVVAELEEELQMDDRSDAMQTKTMVSALL